MSSSRRIVGSAGTTGTPNDMGSTYRSTPKEGQKTSDENMIDEDFGTSVGESKEDVASYQNVYEIIKQYPEWVARLDANPYKGFDAPASLWDNLGLSNKQKDKMLAYQQAYREYNAEILRQFNEWYNSLPSSQREQYVEAGYNADLMNVQPSKMSDGAPQVNASPDEMESGSSAEQLFSSITSIMSLISGGVTAGLGAMQSIKQIRKLSTDTEAQDLANFSTAYGIAKTIFGDTAPTPESDDSSIAPSFKLQLKNAPKKIQDILDSFGNSRGFTTALNTAIKSESDSASDVVESAMRNEQVDVLYGTPEVWKDLRTMYRQAQRLQYKNLTDYYGSLDTALMARSANAQSQSSAEFFEQYDSSAAADVTNKQNSAALQSLRYQKALIDSKLKMIGVRTKIIDSLFEAAQSEKKGKSIAARSALLALDFGSEYLGLMPTPIVGGTTFGSSPAATPSVPSM